MTFNRSIRAPLRYWPLLLAFIAAWVASPAAHAAPPQWWSTYGVLSGYPPNDFAAANQGQVKNFFVAAVSEMDTDLAQFGGAGPQLDQLAATLLSGPTAGTNDYAAVNLGQLKKATQPIYDRLIALGYNEPPINFIPPDEGGASTSGTYPWANTGWLPNDYAAANIGQVKNLFSFDVTYSSSGDGIPDWWLETFFPGQTITASTVLPLSGGDGPTCLQAFQHGLNLYRGQQLLMTVVSGNNQTGPAGGYLPAPLVVMVTDTSGNPVVNAPIYFESSPRSDVEFRASDQSPENFAICVYSNQSGIAAGFCHLGSTSFTYHLQVSAVNNNPSINFTESTDDGSGGPYASPFSPTNVAGTMNSDGSETITWQNNDTGSPIYIYLRSGGAWTVKGTLGAGTTTYTVPASAAGYVEVGNNYSPGGSTGTVSGGSSKPGSDPFVPIPQQSYAAINLSGSVATNTVTNVALSDSNQAAFVFQNDYSSEWPDYPDLDEFENCPPYNIYTWQNGALSNSPIVSPGVQVYPPGPGETDGWLHGKPAAITPNGNLYGTDAEYSFGNDGSFIDGGRFDNIYSSIDGNAMDTGLPTDLYDYDIWFADPGIGTINASENGAICGGANMAISASYVTGTTGNGQHSFNYILQPGSNMIVFDPTSYQDVSVPSNVYISPTTFNLVAVNDSGYAIGSTGTNAAIWTGISNGLTQLAPMVNATAISAYGQVVGSSGTSGYLWTSGTVGNLWPAVQPGQVQTIVNLLPPAYQNEIQSVTPISISGVNPTDGSVNILLSATYQTDPQGDTATANFVLTLSGTAVATSSSNPTIFQQISNSPSSPQINFQSGIINSQAVIAGLGASTSHTGNDAYLLLPADIVPDYNHDGKIDDNDRGKATTDNPYRFWINDQDSSGSDIPGSGTPNYGDWSIDGIADLDNWFPVFLDIKSLVKLLPPGTFTYRLKQADSAVNFVYTTLTPATSGTFLTDLNTANGLVSQTAGGHPNNGVYAVSGTGSTALDTTFLTNIRDNGEGVILLEGKAKTQNPLELVVYDSNNNQVVDLKMPLSLDGIEKMYRHINLMSASNGSGGRSTDLSEPSNFPDSLCTSKSFVFVHGYNVNPDQARGWNAEFFKRMYWSGSRAKFYGVTWNGAQSQQSAAGNLFTPDYQSNVDNAFATAKPFAQFVNNLGGNVTVAAHSLGNMLVASAIQDWNANISNYYLIDGAVALESYSGSISQESNMTHPDWTSYQTRVWASEWYLDSSLASGDGRTKLTWRNRLSGVGANTYNFYSGSEDVLRKHTGDPSVTSVLTTALTGGRYAWALQEKLKGRRIDLSSILGVTAFVGSTYGGWAFTDSYSVPPGPPHTPSATEAASIPDATLLTTPVFDPGYHLQYSPPPPPGVSAKQIHNGAPSWILSLTDPANASNTASTHRNQLLAEMFPARTLPIGGEGGSLAGSIVGAQHNFDMPALFITDTSQWPDQTQYNGDLEWLHSDVKNVPFPHLYQIYQKFVSLGNLKQ